MTKSNTFYSYLVFFVFDEIFFFLLSAIMFCFLFFGLFSPVRIINLKKYDMSQIKIQENEKNTKNLVRMRIVTIRIFIFCNTVKHWRRGPPTSNRQVGLGPQCDPSGIHIGPPSLMSGPGLYHVPNACPLVAGKIGFNVLSLSFISIEGEKIWNRLKDKVFEV